MQAIIKMKAEKLQLPLHYNSIIQGFIYKNLANSNFREFLHEVGFKTRNRSFKLFTFSNIYGRYEINKKNKTITFFDEFSIYVSSIVDDFIKNLLQTFLSLKQLSINNQPVELMDVEIIKKRKLREKVLVRTLSPIVTYTTLEIEGNKKTIYHSPKDKIFNNHIKNNLIKKTEALGQKLDNKYFEIRIPEGKEIKKNVTYFKNIVVIGWSGLFELQGNPELINIAINCGLGAKNSQGFGYIKMIKNI